MKIDEYANYWFYSVPLNLESEDPK